MEFNAPDISYSDISPIIALTAGTILVLMAGLFGSRKQQRIVVSIIGFATLAAAAGLLIAQWGAHKDLIAGALRLDDLAITTSLICIGAAAFCIPLDEADERFEESMALIRRALSSDERFSHHSARWHFEDIVVEPPPVQRPHPPLWLAAGRPDSIRKAAAGGYSLLLDQFATFDVTLQRFRTYRDAIAAGGRGFDPMTVAVARGIAIVRDGTERERAIAQRIDSLDRMNRLGRSADGRYVSSMNSDPDLRKAAVEGTLIGTPGEIVDQLRQLRNGGVEYVLLAGPQGSPRLLHDFAAEVMPAFA